MFDAYVCVFSCYTQRTNKSEKMTIICRFLFLLGCTGIAPRVHTQLVKFGTVVTHHTLYTDDTCTHRYTDSPTYREWLVAPVDDNPVMCICFDPADTAVALIAVVVPGCPQVGGVTVCQQGENGVWVTSRVVASCLVDTTCSDFCPWPAGATLPPTTTGGTVPPTTTAGDTVPPKTADETGNCGTNRPVVGLLMLLVAALSLWP